MIKPPIPPKKTIILYGVHVPEFIMADKFCEFDTRKGWG